MDKRQLLVEMSWRLYEDCRYLAESNATQPVDEDGCMVFNTVLAEMQSEYPTCMPLSKFRELPPRSVKFKDATILAGQMYCLAQCLAPAADATPARPRTPLAAAASASASRASGTSAPAGRSAPVARPGRVAPPPPEPTRDSTSERRTPPPAAPGKSKADEDFKGFLNNDDFRVSFKDLE